MNEKRGGDLSISALARLFRRDRSTIRRAIHDCQIEPAGQHRGNATYSANQIAQALYAVPPNGDGDLSPLERLNYYRSELCRRQLQVQDRELIPAHEFDRAYSDMIKTLAAMLESLPDVLERDAGLSGKQVQPVVRAVDSMREEMYQRLVQVHRDAG